jgi:hypothetical protein
MSVVLADWGLIVRDAPPPKGKGVFASVDIPAASLVFKFSGPVYSRNSCPNFDESIQVGPDEFMWSSGGVDDYINHSCDPNVGLCTRDDGLYTRALKEIPAGTELVYDYSTAMLTDPTSMACACHARSCRGRITNFFDLPEPTQHEYARLDAVPAFMRQAAELRGTPLPLAHAACAR